MRPLLNLTPSLVFLICAASIAFGGAAQPAYAQIPASAESACEILLMPKGGSAQDGQFADGAAFLENVYGGAEDNTQAIFGLPVRAVMCRREQLAPSLRDYPIVKTGVPLSISQDFDSRETGLLTIYDTGAEYKAEYSGPQLPPATEAQLREALKIFNLQKLAE